jgi:hypothetical protein
MMAPDPASTAPGAARPVVWLLCDGRAGHRSQLRGLAAALERRGVRNPLWVDARAHRTRWRDLVFRRCPDSLPVRGPDLAVGAGHGTHRLLLTLGRAHRCLTCVLMRPSLPFVCFDAAIVPLHDGPPQRDSVLPTRGVLNAIQPSANPDPARGLILLGGPSRHFGFPLDDICKQVRGLCGRFPEVQMMLSDSRRSPPELIPALRRDTPANLTLVDHRDTASGWLATTLADCGQAWVSEDSVSMVYEALSAGVATGVFTLPRARDGRLQQGLAALRDEGFLNALDAVLAGQPMRAPPHALQEAERAADWLLARVAGG